MGICHYRYVSAILYFRRVLFATARVQHEFGEQDVLRSTRRDLSRGQIYREEVLQLGFLAHEVAGVAQTAASRADFLGQNVSEPIINVHDLYVLTQTLLNRASERQKFDRKALDFEIGELLRMARSCDFQLNQRHAIEYASVLRPTFPVAALEMLANSLLIQGR